MIHSFVFSRFLQNSKSDIFLSWPQPIKVMQEVINDLKSLYSTTKKGYEVVKGTLLLLDKLESEIKKLPKPTKENKTSTNYAEIEGVILNVIVSDKTPVDVLVIRRALCRCLNALYINNPILASKSSSKLVNFVQNLTASSKIMYFRIYSFF
jgi:hypothetical protein